jgi:hypothetical protein
MKKGIFILLNLTFCYLSIAQEPHADTLSERKTRNGAWILYSKAKTINGLGLSVNPFRETEEYLNTTVNGMNLQVDFAAFFVTSMYLVHALFDKDLVLGFVDRTHNSGRGFESKLVTNGLNIKLLSFTEPEITNGISIKLLDIENTNNGLSIAFIARRKTHNGLAISALSNVDHAFKGAQIGLFNKAGRANGVQIGLFNKSRLTKGIQIGLWNVNEKRSLPFVNWRF